MRQFIRLASLASICVLGSGACNSRSARNGPLAVAADSLLAGTRPECVSLAQNPGPGEAPFRECRATKGDTAIIVINDAMQKVVLISREWRVDSSAIRADFQDLEERLTLSHGVGQQACQDPSFAPGRMWRTAEYHSILAALPISNSLYFGQILGAPLCGQQ